MRLAIIRQDLVPEASTELFLEAALEALLERDVAVTLYTRKIAPLRLQLIEQVRCDPFHVGRLWRDASFARAACRALARARANVIEAHLPLPCCDVYRADNGVYASWFDEELAHSSPGRRLRLRASPHWRFLLAAERQMFASPWLSAVICPSTLVRDDLRARFGLPEAKLHVIPHPVDTVGLTPALRSHRAATLAQHGVSPAATVFLFASNEWNRDGARVAIAAVVRAPAPAHLLLLGRPPTPRTPERWLREQGAIARATFVGQAANPRVYLGAADAFVLPAQYDPRGAAVLDAMAARVVPIVSARSGAAVLVREHDGGLVVPASDASGWASAIAALTDPARRERLAINARHAVLSMSRAAMTLRAVLLYRDLLAATARAALRRGGRAAPPVRPLPVDEIPTLSTAAARPERSPATNPDRRAGR